MKKTIGLVGETGAGKDVFCEYIKKKYSKVFCFRFSQPLTEALGIFFDEAQPNPTSLGESRNALDAGRFRPTPFHERFPGRIACARRDVPHGRARPRESVLLQGLFRRSRGSPPLPHFFRSSLEADLRTRPLRRPGALAGQRPGPTPTAGPSLADPAAWRTAAPSCVAADCYHPVSIGIQN